LQNAETISQFFVEGLSGHTITSVSAGATATKFGAQWVITLSNNLANTVRIEWAASGTAPIATRIWGLAPRAGAAVGDETLFGWVANGVRNADGFSVFGAAQQFGTDIAQDTTSVMGRLVSAASEELVATFDTIGTILSEFSWLAIAAR
jgi:hypothetical protein